jgi:hypothetical protein
MVGTGAKLIELGKLADDVAEMNALARQRRTALRLAT